MCAYVNAIINTVEDFVNNNKMFTAFDVTTKLRASIKTPVKHSEVKREVHKMFDTGSLYAYNRTLANLPGVHPQPWIYHPVNVDPLQYGKTPAPVMNTISAVEDDSGAVDNGTVTYKFDSTDRLCVPNRLVRQLGLKEGDNVLLVEAAPNVMNIYPETSVLLVGVNPVASYMVDRYDNVRISRTKLNGVAFEMDGDAQKITLKRYA